MKKIIAVILCCTACLSCQSQGKTDLEKTGFSKNYKEILKGARVKTEAREMITTLPIAHTPDVSHFTFGNIAFTNSKANAIKSSSVGVLINNTTERLTEGIKIEVEDTAAGNELLAYLKSKYKAPKVLSGIPGKNSEGKVLGNSAYAWTLRDKTLVLVQYYEYTDNKPNISSVLFMVDNKATAPEVQQNVAARIIKTFTP